MQWPPTLMELRVKLEALTKHSFNSVLCNLYRDNHDGVDFHSDDEPSLGKNPYIASISLGAVRVFEMRKKPLPVPNKFVNHIFYTRTRIYDALKK